MTSKFVRRNTIVELKIEGRNFRVDFGRDEVPGILGDTNDRLEKLEKQYDDIEDIRERRTVIDSAQKKVIEAAIDELLQNPKASADIFAEDQSSLFHADVYTYITGAYADMLSQDNSPYAPNRAQRRTGR